MFSSPIFVLKVLIHLVYKAFISHRLVSETDHFNASTNEAMICCCLNAREKSDVDFLDLANFNAVVPSKCCGQADT